MTAIVLRGDARSLPLPDASVDLIVTSPPYFGLRSYTDGGQHYDGQIGSEGTPGEFVAALVACTAEFVRVLKPSGSLFVNLGDKYSGAQQQSHGNQSLEASGDYWRRTDPRRTGIPNKSLMGLPWRYALACTDTLSLILRAEIIWAKPNGLPESVTDRVRRSHEQVFHFTRQPRYYAAVDEIREEHTGPTFKGRAGVNLNGYAPPEKDGLARGPIVMKDREYNPLGKLPSSVWSIPSQPLTVPECRLVIGGQTVRWFMTWAEGQAYMRLLRRGWDGPGRPSLRPEISHFAAYPPELVRRIVLGWSPPGVCCGCGEGRRPVSLVTYADVPGGSARAMQNCRKWAAAGVRGSLPGRAAAAATITGYACACPDTSAPARPAIVLDPFAGTGTTMLVASAYGRTGIGVDRSHDYCRLARWRCSDPGERARALRVPKPPPIPHGQASLFDDDPETAAI